MAFGDHDESKLLLPGGSKVEGFEVDSRESRKHRRAAVLVISSVAAVACLATALTHHGRSELVAVTKATKPSAQLSQQSTDLADVYLQKHGIPSWLSTSDVKLKPLSAMIHEQLAVKQMAKAKLQQKMDKQQAKAAHQLSPHELAMKNVLHSQASAKVEAKKSSIKKAADTQLHEVSEDTATVHYKTGSIKAKQAEVEQITKGEHAEELVIETAEEQKLEAIRKEEQKINEEEVSKLASVKKEDDVRVKKIEDEIQVLKKEKSSEQLSEKRKIKAEMAKIEDEEHEKLIALKEKMKEVAAGKINKDDSTPAASKSSKAATAKTETARGHKTVQKPAVKVHLDSAAGDEKSDTAKEALAKAVAKTSALCTTTKCDLAEEDKQWSQIGGSVGQIAKEAESAHGKARKDALAHMKFLQEQIAQDYKHVTAFAVAQEHALPPAPKMA